MSPASSRSVWTHPGTVAGITAPAIGCGAGPEAAVSCQPVSRGLLVSAVRAAAVEVT